MPPVQPRSRCRRHRGQRACKPYIESVGPTIVDAKAAQRYEARVEGDLAGFIDYVVKGDRLALIHTEVLPTHQGQGIAEHSGHSHSMTLVGEACG